MRVGPLAPNPAGISPDPPRGRAAPLRVLHAITPRHVSGAELLVLGWGSTYGTITAAVRRVRAEGKKVASAHLHHLNPWPKNTGDVVRSYPKVLIPEMNTGQLLKLIRAEYLVDAVGYNKVRGLPFRAAELEDAIDGVLRHAR